MTVSDGIVGVLMSVLGVVGLFAAARAEDEAMYIFGLSLFAYACLFVLGQIRRHYDTVDLSARESGHG